MLSANPLSYADGFANDAETMGITIPSDQVVCLDDGRCQYFPNPDGSPTSTLNNFAGFTGQNKVGAWPICFADVAAGDTGVLSSVTLELNTTPVELLQFEIY